MAWNPVRRSWESLSRRREEADRSSEAREPADGRVASPVGCLGCLVTVALVALLAAAAVTLLSWLGW